MDHVGHSVPIEQLSRKEIREFLDWVHEQAVAEKGSNPGRTVNKARENLRAVLSWAWEQDLLETLPRFPPPREQQDVAGRHYLTKSEINALYFATYQLKRPRGWRTASRLAVTGGALWLCSSTMDWTQERSGNRLLSMNPSSGDTSPGINTHPMDVRRTHADGDGFIFGESRLARRSTVR